MLLNDNYAAIAEQIKKDIEKTDASINSELIMLYYRIGKIINENKAWGNKFIDRLEKDLQQSFPTNTGYSVRSLKYMSKFAAEYTDIEFVQTVSAQLPWSHNTLIMEKVKDDRQRRWYMEQAIEKRWTFRTLKLKIENNLYEKENNKSSIVSFSEQTPESQNLQKINIQQPIYQQPHVQKISFFTEKTSFSQDSPKPQSMFEERRIQQARLSTFDEGKDRERISRELTRLLLAYGTGFNFIGKDYKLVLEGGCYYLYLLFYNTDLHCYFVTEIQQSEYNHNYIRHLSTRLSYVDKILNKPEDTPAIGLLLRKNRDDVNAEYLIKTKSGYIVVNIYPNYYATRMPPFYATVVNKLPDDYAAHLPPLETIIKILKNKK